jgi:hypothetical protein
MMEYKNVDPKCLTGENAISYTTRGYIVPCCWCDSPSIRPLLEMNGMYEDELKVENVDKIEHIFLSDQWIDFYNNLDRFPACLHYCSKNENT